MTLPYEKAAGKIIQAGKRLDSQNLAPATSGNYSVRINKNEMAITVSGVHKGQLEPEHIMRANLDGKSLDGKTPSAETLLHCLIYKLCPNINAVLHTHSVACAVLTKLTKDSDILSLEGYEMLKAFPQINTHDTILHLPIFENTQDMTELSAHVGDYLKEFPKTPAYLIRAHGIYGWGADIDEAMRVIEALEAMLLSEMHILSVTGYPQQAKSEGS